MTAEPNAKAMGRISVTSWKLFLALPVTVLEPQGVSARLNEFSWRVLKAKISIYSSSLFKAEGEVDWTRRTTATPAVGQPWARPAT